MNTLAWRKPALERHAHVSEELLTLLGKVPKAASDLALYLFRHCIAGKFEEIDLYNLPLGEQRTSSKRSGKRYSQTTLRGALKTLEYEGLVLVRRRYLGGVFSLTVQHPGKTRHFREPEKNSSTSIKNTHTQEKIAQTEFSNDVKTPPLTEESRQHAVQAALEKVSQEFKPTKQTQGFFDPQKNTRPVNKKNATQVKTAQTDASNEENSFPLTEVYRETTEQAAAKRVVENENRPSVRDKVFLPLQETACEGACTSDESACMWEESKPASDRLFSHSENESQEICSEIKQIMPLNPQLKTEALKHTLQEIRAALALYTEKSAQITNPQGWLVQCLRQKWVKEARESVLEESCLAELTKWYAWASKAGIVDGRPLAHCPRSHPHSTSHEFLQVALMIPPHEQKLGFPPFEFVRWQDVIALHPMEN